MLTISFLLTLLLTYYLKQLIIKTSYLCNNLKVISIFESIINSNPNSIKVKNEKPKKNSSFCYNRFQFFNK